MPKGTGQRGHRTKGDAALSRKATQHHDFVGQAEPDREQLEKDVVKRMAQELEQASGVSPPSPPASAVSAQAAPEQDRPRFEMPGSLREGIELIRRRGPEALDAMRAKAEQRLGEMPSPVRTAVHLTERAVGLALWPVRAGARLVGRVLETPITLLRILIARRTT
jgi:hypothetical protein